MKTVMVGSHHGMTQPPRADSPVENATAVSNRLRFTAFLVLNRRRSSFAKNRALAIIIVQVMGLPSSELSQPLASPKLSGDKARFSSEHHSFSESNRSAR
jgi:hypothetical protein